MIPDGIYFAETETERRAVEQLRFRRFVKELKICHPDADYQQHRLPLPDDALARLLYIQELKEIVGCARLYLVSHARYTDQQQALFSPMKLHSLAQIEHTAIQDMVLLQRTEQTHYEELTVRIFRFAIQCATQMGATLLFTTCREADFRLYRQMGFRPYREYYNSLETGLLLPLVLLLSDSEYLRRLNSPLLGSYSIPRSDSAHSQHALNQCLLPFPLLGAS